MNRSPVTSSNIRAVGYDLATKTLEVEFHSGSVHQYHDVPAATHQKLISARSVGAHFHANIRDRFRSSQVD